MSVNLEDMSVDELKAYIVEQEGKEKIADKIQHAFKILLNSVYGAMGTPYFRMYNMHIAEGITLSGQAAVSQSYSMFNDYLNKKLKSNHDYIVASDTDSVVGETIINISGKDITIADYYKAVQSKEDEYKSGRFIKPVDTLDSTLTFDGTYVVTRPVRYVMKHAVKKQMYKISVGDSHVIVTGDHAIKAIDDSGKLVDVKPADLNADDHMCVLLVSIKASVYADFISDFTVEYLGEYEETVYDIEVEDTHSFFANGILVHNSAYVDLSRFVNAIIPTDTPHTKKVDAVVKLCDEHFAGMLESTFDEFAEATNAWSNSIDMKREAVATACFVAKKNYVMNVYDNEGTRYASPKQKITGLEAIKSSTPEFLRGKLKEGYHYVFGSTETELQAYVTRTKAEYMALPISKIAGTISVNEIDKFEDGSGGYVSGTPGHVRGAISYNTAIKKMGLGNKYELIRPGDKVKIVPLKLPNPLHATSLCFLSTFPHEIINEKYINRDDNYDKYFVKPITRVIAIAKWKHEYTPSLSELFG